MRARLEHHSRTTKRWGKLSAAVAALTLLLLGVAPAASYAATVDAITKVVVNPDANGNPDGKPINLYQGVKIQAEWKAPADAKAGDTFELTFPDVIKGNPASFDLKDKAGALVGTCKVQDTKIVCTFTDYVETHDNVTGSLRFAAQAVKETDVETWTWNEGTEHEVKSHVDGGVGPYDPKIPQDSFKSAWRTADGKSIAWQVTLLGKDLVTPGGNPVTLVDTYDQRLSLDQTSFGVETATPAQYQAGTWTPLSKGSASGQYSVDFGTNNYTLNIHGADPDKLYRVVYSTPIPAGTVAGTKFSNRVQADGKDFVETTYTHQTADGEGGGDQKVGVVTWNKVDPDGKALAGSEWSVTGPDGTAAPVVDNGENDKDPAVGKLKITGIAWGTYTLTETKAPAGYVKAKVGKKVVVDGTHLNVTFGDITNSPEPTVPPTVPTEPTTPTEPTQPTTPTEPTQPTEPTVPTEPTTPAEPTQPSHAAQSTTPSEPPLAHTGAAVTVMALIAALLVLAGAGSLLLGKRRRHQ
ncbi:Ig-like domain-containing protein [Galactobacter caseinivorans]|uniref:Ig-like domain-containing protein n=1 Tax=Galactobacter caseinivorans TaxID=2676123 RepID=UPI0011C38D0A|nr:Ig-like domain-containing protein [Galactobacter caseinivorans]